MHFISFSLNYFQHPLLMSIFQFIQTISGRYYKPQSLILTPILSASSHLLAIFQEDVSIFNELLTQRDKLQLKQEASLLDKKKTLFSFPQIVEQIKQEKTHLYLLLLALGLSNIFPHSLYMIISQFREARSTQSFLTILFTSLFCCIILKAKLYRHHYIAITIFVTNITLYLALNYGVIDSHVADSKDLNWPLFIVLSLLYIISISLREVLEKYIMEKHFLTSYRILLIEGVFLLAVFLLYLLIIQFIPCEDLAWLQTLCYMSQWAVVKADIADHFSYSSFSTVFVWLYIFSVYIGSYFRVETINKLSPTHRFVGEFLSLLYWLIFALSMGEITKMIWLEVLQVLLLLFASLVFNEIIIIHLFRLHYNTKREIEGRANKDSHSMMETLELINMQDNG